VNPRLHNDRSFLFHVCLENDTLRRMELFPASLQYAGVRLARGAERVATLDRMEELSAEMGTVFRRRNDRLELEL
jgi:hypothetical protein